MKKDKIYHIIAGIIIALITYYIGKQINRDMFEFAPFLVALCAGFFKEMYDVFFKGYFSFSDLAYTGCAGLIFNIILIL